MVQYIGQDMAGWGCGGVGVGGGGEGNEIYSTQHFTEQAWERLASIMSG